MQEFKALKDALLKVATATGAVRKARLDLAVKESELRAAKSECENALCALADRAKDDLRMEPGSQPPLPSISYRES